MPLTTYRRARRFGLAKRPFKRRRGRQTWRNIRLGTMARYAFRGVKYLKSMVNAEKKKLDAYFHETVGTSPEFMQLNQLGQGDTDSSRNGNSVLMHSLHMFGFLRINSAATQPQMVRLVVVLDTQQLGDTTPGWADIFQNTSALTDHLNDGTVGRFTILSDKRYALTDTRSAIPIKSNIRLGVHARYNGTSISDIQKNGLYFFIVSDDNTNQPYANLQFRLNYYDN